jgi:hypothetical protein
MVRAAAARGIDFEQADPDDKWWWLRTDLILEEIAQQDKLRWTELRHRHYAALVASGKISDDSFADAQEVAIECTNSAYKLLFPWEAAQSEAVNRDLIQMWYDEFGDPEDPEVAAKIDEWVAAIYAVQPSDLNQDDED